MTAFTLPFTTIVEFLIPYKLIVWLSSVFSTVRGFSFSKCSYPMLEKHAHDNTGTPYDKPLVAFQHKLARLLPCESLRLCRLQRLLRRGTSCHESQLRVITPSHEDLTLTT